MSKSYLVGFYLLAMALAPAAASAQAAKATDSEQTFLDFQVETAARIKSQAAPTYPDHLRANGIEGSVLVQFIVDESGTPQMGTFKVLRSTDPAFSESVRRAVSRMSFFPAEIKGKKVKQLVQQPYKFATASK